MTKRISKKEATRPARGDGQREEKLRQTLKMEAIGQLAGGIAHDFNNLLTLINGYAELLMARETLSDSVREDVRQIHRAGERAAVLTKRLLSFSRQQEPETRNICLNEIIVEMEPMLRRLIPENIAVAIRLHAAKCPVRVDPTQMEQVILNLAANARDAMPEGGCLTFETGTVPVDDEPEESRKPAPGRYAVLTITDTGVGMSEAIRARMFELFFTTKEPGKGTGFGLAMVCETVRQAGGHIRVSSEPGTGTTFRIHLPLLPACEQTPPDAAGRGQWPSGDETVLLVEDNDEVRHYVGIVLTGCGYTVIPTRDGDEALAYSSTPGRPVHLLITDVVMPGKSGRDIAFRLHQERPEMKVLYMSGYSDDTLALRSLPGKPAAFLQKPFTAESLVDKVRQLLDEPERLHPHRSEGTSATGSGERDGDR